MDYQKEQAIRALVDQKIKAFAEAQYRRHRREAENPEGVINSKKNNCFIAELGEEFMFYSAFVRSFDSSFGGVLEDLGNEIARLSFEVRGKIDSFILPQQQSHMDAMFTEYDGHRPPKIEDYDRFSCMIPGNVASYAKTHDTDNYFYDPVSRTHYVIELKSGGDLDNKKAKAEKRELLTEYFLLRNKYPEDSVHIYLATAYNRFGEGNPWRQSRVLQYFDLRELLIGRDYWNFVCGSRQGFDILFSQYRESAGRYIREALKDIKNLYFKDTCS